MINKTLCIAALAGLSGASAFAASPLVVSAGGDNGKFEEHTGSEPDWDTFWVSERTVELNRLLFEMRDQIAAMATWDGVNPQDLGLLRHNGENRLPNGTGMIPVRGSGVKIASGSRRSGPGAGTGFGARSADDFSGDNRSLARSNLWPGGVIPYTFSDFMINSFFFVADPSPEEINAAAGVSNALAVMILLEQDTPLKFVPYDPGGLNAHPVTGFLLWENIGDGENPPPAEDLDDADTANTVTRVGRNNQPFNPATVPTTVSHGFWQNFPSMIRSMGFVVGLDWEQRHPDRDETIIVNFENIPPAVSPDGTAWPTQGPTPPGIGPNTPGFPNVQELDDAGQELFVIADDPSIFPPGAFDLDSMMLVDPFAYNNPLEMYTIRSQFRFRDLDGDGNVDTTVGGPDDLMVADEPVYFSAGDLAAIADLYAISGDLCPGDIDSDGQITDNDITTYLGWYNAGDVRAELTGDTCTDPDGDGIANNGCITVDDLVQFFVNLQQSTGCQRGGLGIGGDNTIQPI